MPFNEETIYCLNAIEVNIVDALRHLENIGQYFKLYDHIQNVLLKIKKDLAKLKDQIPIKTTQEALRMRPRMGKFYIEQWSPTKGEWVSRGSRSDIVEARKFLIKTMQDWLERNPNEI